MNVETIAMPRGEALKAFREYRASVRARATLEELALVRGYKALSKGQVLLDVGDVIKTCGVDGQSRPRVAIVRADAKFCHFEAHSDGAGVFMTGAGIWRKAERVAVPPKTFPDATRVWRNALWVNNQNIAKGVLKTVTPLVPPPLRPKHDLKNYHILWEVESWEIEPPRDPILCKHLAGMLYAVVAQWELSPLERAILRGRFAEASR